MRRASRLRRVEMAFWAMGISLLGVALGATFDRWNYQAQQERAFFSATQTVAVAPERIQLPTLAVAPAIPVGAAQQYGPPAPQITRENSAAVPLEKQPEVLRETAPRRAAEERTSRRNTEAFGRIEIPRLGVKAIVREGADQKTLARAVGLVPGAAQPGELGNVVLAGHRDTFFRRLRRIEINDRIRLVVPPNEYEYQVESVRIVSPDETSVLQSNGVEKLTLVTCYPFGFIGPAPDRFIVSATRVN